MADASYKNRGGATVLRGGTQETIIYRLVMRNHDLDAFYKTKIVGGEKGRGHHAGAKVSRASRPNQKVGP